MDFLAIILAIGVGLTILAGVAVFVVAGWFIFKVFRKVNAREKEFDQRWDSRRRF